MALLDDSKAIQWCKNRGLEVLGTGAARRVSTGPSEQAVRFSTEGAVERRFLLAYFLVSELNQVEESGYSGGLLWLSRWDIGSDVVEAPGILLARAMWAPSANAETLLPRAQEFAPGSFVQAQACVALPLLLGWDAHYVPASGAFAAGISHEGFVEISSAEEGIVERVEERCSAASVKLLPV